MTSLKLSEEVTKVLSLGLLNLRAPRKTEAHSLCLNLRTLTLTLPSRTYQKIAGHLLSVPPQVEETYAEQDNNLPLTPLVHYFLEKMSTEKDTS